MPLAVIYIPLSLCGGKGLKWRLSWSPLVFSTAQSSVLWVCHRSVCGLRDSLQETSFLKFLSLVFPWFMFLCHLSSIKLSSGHWNLILTIACLIHHRPPSQVHCMTVVGSIWDTPWLVIAFIDIICVLVLFPLVLFLPPLTPMRKAFLFSVNFSSFMTPSPRRASIPKNFSFLMSLILSHFLLRDWFSFLSF